MEANRDQVKTPGEGSFLQFRGTMILSDGKGRVFERGRFE
jgi:hypothetical protein